MKLKKIKFIEPLTKVVLDKDWHDSNLSNNGKYIKHELKYLDTISSLVSNIFQ